MEKIERDARATIPEGFYIVGSGPIRPDDLVYSWTSGEWLRADDHAWTSRAIDAGDCVACVRRARLDFPGTSARTYRIPRPTPFPALGTETPKPALRDLNTSGKLTPAADPEQMSLF